MVVIILFLTRQQVGVQASVVSTSIAALYQSRCPLLLTGPVSGADVSEQGHHQIDVHPLVVVAELVALQQLAVGLRELGVRGFLGGRR